MYPDTDKIAQELYDRSLTAEELDFDKISPMLRSADPSWLPFEQPGNYRWFLIKKFPVSKLEVTLDDLMENSWDPGDDKHRHDLIVAALKSGAPEWPAFLTASGILSDGYHRIAAHRTLKRKNIPVIVSVTRPELEGKWAPRTEWVYQHWDDSWNEAFPS